MPRIDSRACLPDREHLRAIALNDIFDLEVTIIAKTGSWLITEKQILKREMCANIHCDYWLEPDEPIIEDNGFEREIL